MQRDPLFESRCKITLLCFYKMKVGEIISQRNEDNTLIEGRHDSDP